MVTEASAQIPISANDDVERVRQLNEWLDSLTSAGDVRPSIQLRGADGRTFDMPTPVYALLNRILPVLAQGDAVSIVEVHKELTIQAAANLLNVSRPFFLKLLDSGVLPYLRVGTRRRVRLGDVLAYQDARSKERRAYLAQMSEVAQRAGAYD